MEEASILYTAFTIGNLEFFECDCMPFGLCNVPATFQRLMQNYLSKLNLIYCLIYLDDIVIFLWMVEEYLHQLCVVFDWFREYNLILKLSKCSFFKEKITYLAYKVSKEGVWPRDFNLKAIEECALPQTYTEVHAFLSLMGHYWWFIKSFACIAQPLNDHLTGEGASRKSEWVLLSEDALTSLEALKQVCMATPILTRWLYQTISAWDQCVQGQTRGSAVSETGRWVVPSSGLWQQSPYASQEKLQFN